MIIQRQNGKWSCGTEHRDQQKVDDIQTDNIDKKEYSEPKTLSQYKEMMSKLKEVSMPSLIESLKKEGIIYSPKPEDFSSKFTKECLKTDWQSIIYEIRYGGVRMSMKVLSLDLEPDLLNLQYVNKGSYGQICKLELRKGEAYAIKCIEIDSSTPNQLNDALREIFFAKLLSALKVGPKFAPILHYDAILFRKSIQFAMELCGTSYDKSTLSTQVLTQSLLGSLKVLHALRICHHDIKFMNIGWSDLYGKFVFLDFNFTQFVDQWPGEKTDTEFMGTYTYCSPEMKKLYLLRKRSFVDLYYNDLYGLLTIWQEMQEISSREESSYACSYPEEQEEMLDMLERGLKQKELSSTTVMKSTNEMLLRYLGFKLRLFLGDSQTIGLGPGEKVLGLVFRKMMERKQVPGSNIAIHQSLTGFSLSEKLKSKSNILTQLTEALLAYQINKSTADSQCLKSWPTVYKKILQLCQSQTLFTQYWPLEQWKQSLFFFIDVYSNTVEKSEVYRKLLVKKIWKAEGQGEQGSDTMQLRTVLIYYFEFFWGRGNFVVLERIVGYFVLMDDQYNTQRMEDRILGRLFEQRKYQEYFTLNVRLFLGKIVLPSRASTISTKKLIQNLQNLQQYLSPSGQLARMVALTIPQLQTLREVRFDRILSPQSQNTLNAALKQYLSRAAPFLAVDVGSFIRQVLVGRYFYDFRAVEQCQFRCEPVLDSQILEIYALKMRLMSQTNKLQLSALAQSLHSNPFLHQYPTIHHTITSKCPQIYLEYLQLANNSKFTPTINYIQAYLHTHSWGQLCDRAAEYFEQYQLADVGGLEDLALLLGEFMNVVMAAVMEIRRVRGSRDGAVHRLARLVLPLLHFCQPLYPQADPGQAQQGQQVAPFYSQTCLNTSQILKLLLLFLTGQPDKASQILLQILKKRLSRIFDECLFLYLLCSLESEVSSQTRIQIQEMIDHVGNLMATGGHFNRFYFVPELLGKILAVHSGKRLYGEAMLFMEHYCREMTVRTSPELQWGYFEAIYQFTKLLCPASQLLTILKAQLQKQLYKFTQYPHIVFFLGFVYFHLYESSIELSTRLKKRMIVVCLMFIHYFPQGKFRKFKSKLLKENMGIKEYEDRATDRWKFRRGRGRNVFRSVKSKPFRSNLLERIVKKYESRKNRYQQFQS